MSSLTQYSISQDFLILQNSDTKHATPTFLQEKKI